MALLSTTEAAAPTFHDLEKSAYVDVKALTPNSGATSTAASNIIEDAIEVGAHKDDASSNAEVFSLHSSMMEEDPAVIVGIGCRLPGGIRSPSGLWDLLASKKSATGKVPSDRFNMNAFQHPDGAARAGVMEAAGGYFLAEDVRQFDNGFFGINNLEATHMDPQQRKLLEVTYECLESAGLSLDDVSGTNTGVYVGNFTVDFQTMQTRDPDYVHRYSATGSGTAIMANRISHVFNLQGPSFTLDTACSSSIYGLHNAVVALRTGDCDAAIVAGANLITSSEQHLGTAKGGVLSATSECHTFDVSADGYGRAEAVNAVYIKRLSSALRDGDNIRAVIRGTAVNANGRTPGIIQPSATLQEKVIRKAYANAGLRFEHTDYVECHGTGTAIGDPIEVDGIGRCFSEHRQEGSPLLIGAVKTNIGHSEAASGLSAVIKVILAFGNGKIPPTYGVTKLNPKLRLDELNLKVVTEMQEWPRALRRASINSFGYGGANAHAILESIESYLPNYNEVSKMELAPGPSNAADEASSKPMIVLPISAATKWSLDQRVNQISSFTKNCDADTLRRLAFTLSERRSNLAHRAFILVGEDKEERKIQLAPTCKTIPTDLGFVFTGQGAQYAEMAKGLLFKSPSFQATIRHLDSVLRALPASTRPSWTLEETLLDSAETSQIHNVTRSQPICTAVQVGLVDLLHQWNVSPIRVVGHSSGEIAAAYAAGLLTASQAILVAYFRGFAVGKLQSQGTMMAAGLSVGDADELIEECGLVGKVCVACVNAPESVTISGETEGIEKLLPQLQGKGKFARKLQTGGRAYHSHMMRQIGDLYEELLTPVFDVNRNKQDQMPLLKASMYSSVGKSSQGLATFESVSSLNKMTARYWRDNLENPVQFNAALGNLTADGKIPHLIELGPHAALKGPIEQIRKTLKRDFLYSPTLLRNEDASRCIQTLAGNIFLHHGSNIALNWSSLNGLQQITNLKPLDNVPNYPWDYSDGLLWKEPRASVELRNRKHARHELLGAKQLAGNDIDWSWRNILQINEIPWVKDHKVESQIVFPAAGYLSLAMEAICQIRGVQGLQPGTSFEFRNVNISAALVVPEEDVQDGSDMELHTTMSPRKISTANSSSSWHEFVISSWAAGQSTVHCVGSLRVNDEQGKLPLNGGTVNVKETESYETWSMSRWYKKLDQDGLCFGPQFQSLTSLSTDSKRVRSDAISTTKLLQRIKRSAEESCKDPGTPYAVHPLVLDACLQAAIMGGTAGNLGILRPHLPVFISNCRVRTPSIDQVNTECTIHTRSRTTGFATKQIDATLRDANSVAVIDMQNVRLSLYNGKTVQQEAPTNVALQRHPVLKVCWKPDIGRLHADLESQIKEYITSFTATQPLDMRDHESMAIIWALVDLAAFRNPKMRVLELGSACECRAKSWLETLVKDCTFSRCRSWSSGAFDEEAGKLEIRSGADKDAYDLVILPELAASAAYWQNTSKQLASLVDDRGVLVTRSSPMALEKLGNFGFSVVNVGKDILLAIPPAQNDFSQLGGREVVIVVRNKKVSPAITNLSRTITAYLRQKLNVSQIHTIPLADIGRITSPEKAVFISLLEMEEEFLATMKQNNMDLLRRMTDNATDLIWLTAADSLSPDKPDCNLSLSSGLSRALMLEQPSLRFTVFDIGSANAMSDNKHNLTCENLTRAMLFTHDLDDKEFVQKNGLLHVSRFVPDADVNSLFRRRLENTEAAMTKSLAELGTAQLGIRNVGQTDSLHFQQLCDPDTSTAPPVGFVDIQVKAVSLNAKDIYTLSGRVETRTGTAAIEFSGVVTAVGPQTSDGQQLQVGDHVFVGAPNHFRTIERVPAWAVHKMLPEEEFTVMPTIPTTCGTALYALEDRARLRAGESILVHAGAGAFGIATIVLAQLKGAVVYATVGSQGKRDFLINELGVPSSHIFNSRDSSFVTGVKAATGGRGVDVIINSLVGDLMHDSWDCIADFGRFVEVGKRELVDAGKLDMHVFLRNATFTAFDFTELYFSEDKYYRDTCVNKIKDATELYRAGKLKLPPVAVFDVSNMAQAYRHFSTKDRVGKVVISLENPSSRVPVMPSKYQTLFDASKAYILVGCLGGLGRSLSRWMMSRGARNFVFLGRSGCDKPSARELVTHLLDAGANVTVIRGNVSKKADVEACVAAAKEMNLPIGGVVQAAMGLHEALFTRMPNEAWQTGIEPKWKGTWNLHEALEGCDEALDFFLLTSSVSGSVGTATESNYCAANGFLDSFAHWRRSQGKPAVSVGLGMISEVGYLHENPEIEALLLRKGIQPLNEDEFLQVIDLALAGVDNANQDKNALASHLLTGLEPFGYRELMAQGFDVNNGTTQDPRAGLLAAALMRPDEDTEVSGLDVSALATAAAWAKSLPAVIASTFAAEADAATLNEAVSRLVCKRFSNLILMPLHQVDAQRSLSQFGVDSMIASEFRTWFWSAFKVDVPFLDIMSPQKCLATLADFVEEKLSTGTSN